MLLLQQSIKLLSKKKYYVRMPHLLLAFFSVITSASTDGVHVC